MDDIAEEVEAFYAGYLAAWNARDLEGRDACFALPATFVSPMGTLAVNSRRELRAVLARNFERLQSEGFSQSSAGTLEVRTCADGLAVADVRGLRRLRADGSLQEEIDAHYILRRDGRGWRFVVTMTCTPGWQDS